jgi:hypothetical protein
MSAEAIASQYAASAQRPGFNPNVAKTGIPDAANAANFFARAPMAASILNPLQQQGLAEPPMMALPDLASLGLGGTPSYTELSQAGPAMEAVPPPRRSQFETAAMWGAPLNSGRA